MNAERLLKLADFLEKLPPHLFDLSLFIGDRYWVYAVFPDHFMWDKKYGGGCAIKLKRSDLRGFRAAIS